MPYLIALQVRMDGTSPLWLAANAPDDGGEAAALELLEAGAKADIVGSRGGTALHGAAFHGRAKLASALIAAGCPVNAVNSKTSYTALHTAAETKHPKVCCKDVGRLVGPVCSACCQYHRHNMSYWLKGCMLCAADVFGQVGLVWVER